VLNTGEVLHVRLRRGQAASPRGVLRFAEELIARLEGAGWRYSISVRLQAWVPEAIAQIPESHWQTLEDYPDEGEAQIAETRVGRRRLIVCRTRLLGPRAELWPDGRYLPFLTNRGEPLEVVEAEHRGHAVA
jgi:hypothetical protein